MSGQIAPHLFSIVDELEAGRSTIASRWIELPKVKEVFKTHKISGQKFQEGYGIPIIEYFVSVVREEKEAGDCPIMSRLVNYLVERNITPKEVFDICMGFRHMLVNYLFEKGLIRDPAATIEEVTDLFDANLSGVMNIFGDLYAKRLAKTAELESQEKRLRHILKILNFIKTKIVIWQSGRIVLANQPFFQTVAIKNLQEFQAKYEDHWSFISAIDANADLYAEDKEKWLKSMCEEGVHFKAEIYHSVAKQTLIYSGRVTTLPDTTPPKYIMTLHNINTHLSDEEAQKDRLYRDAMTGFYNYSRFEQLVSARQIEARQNKAGLALAVINLSELKEINEEQGRDSGDTIVMEVAQLLDTYTDESMLLGRFEGSRFGVLLPYEEEQACYDWASHLCEQLNKTATRIDISLTAFDLSEPVNRLFIRGIDLVDLAMGIDAPRVKTDMEVFTQMLPNQDLFYQRFEELKELEMSLFYKEIAVIGTVKIRSVSEEGVLAVLATKQLTAAAPKDNVYFKLPQMGYIQGTIAQLDLKARTVLIKNFRFDSHSPLMRKKVRVMVAGAPIASIVHEERELEGIVLNLNSACVAMSLTRKKSLDSGSSVLLTMTMQTADVKASLETRAVVQRLEKIPTGYKVVFAFNLDASDETSLSQYIASRQMELIQELKRSES